MGRGPTSGLKWASRRRPPAILGPQRSAPTGRAATLAVQVTLVTLAMVLCEPAVPFTAFTGGTMQLRGPTASHPPLRARLLSAAASQNPGDGEGPGPIKMTLEEEFRTGKTLEAEFAEVLDARGRGADIKREAPIRAQNDMEVMGRRAWRQVSDFASRIDFSNGPTLFWALLIGLIVVSWILPLLKF